VSYKEFGSEDTVTVTVDVGRLKAPRKQNQHCGDVTSSQSVKKRACCSEQGGIRAMMKFMPETDKTFYNTIFANR